MNRRVVAALAVAAMAAAGVTNPIPPSALGGGCRHVGNNKPAYNAAKRDRRNRIAKLSRRRNRQK